MSFSFVGYLLYASIAEATLERKDLLASLVISLFRFDIGLIVFWKGERVR